MKHHHTLALFLILSAIFVSCSAQSEDCMDIVESLKTNFSAVPYIDSGKFLNDLGDYNNCLFHD